MPALEATSNLLIVDDDEAIRKLLIIAAKSRGWHPVAAETLRQGCHLLGADIKAVILDHRLPDGDGLQSLARLREKRPNVPVIMLTGLNDAETAVRALRAGADDYLTKPFELEHLFRVIQDACRVRGQTSDSPAADAAAPPSDHDEAQWKSGSPRMRELYRHMAKAARLDITVLLTGESGTGKTHVAREIHRLSPRAGEAFIPVSCPALPRELLESELFGHERGAFTGAFAARAGRFEQASKGTIFLDEIGDLPGELQPKLLTVLQDQEFFRVGGNRILRTEARILAATNIDLQSRVADGRFREDLYYRLNILELQLPPLRDRIEDLPDLARSVLDRIAGKRGVASWTLSAAASEILRSYRWPGNIRQLENVLERATAFAEDAELDERDIAPLIELPPGGPASEPTRVRPLHEVERAAFIEAYQRNGRNKASTARDLGIAERTVYNLLSRYHLK